MKELQGKVVIITGAASPFGEALTAAFSIRGAHVYAVDVNELGLKRVVEVLRQQGHAPTPLAGNSVIPAEVDRLVETVMAERGRIDVLVNSISVFQGGATKSLSLEDWQWIVDSNFWGVAHPVRAVLPIMLAQDSGHIVNTLNLAGLLGLPLMVPYSAAKYGVIGMSEALNAELAATGVLVSTVCTGMVKSRPLSPLRFKLPLTRVGLMQQLHDRIAIAPEKAARQVVRAVVEERSRVVSARELAPFWWSKRFSPKLYAAFLQWLMKLIEARLAQPEPNLSD